MNQPADAKDIRDTIQRWQRTWDAMLNEPQDPQAAERIAAQGKRESKD